MTNPKSLIDDVVEWAELVIMELRIDCDRGSWDRLDKLEDAVAALKVAQSEPSGELGRLRAALELIASSSEFKGASDVTPLDWVRWAGETARSALNRTEKP